MSKPIRQFSKRGIVLSIWKNKGLNITISRLYFDKGSNNRPTYTNNFRTFDLKIMKSLISDAIEDLDKNPIERDDEK